jgi:hypothetical protein
MRLALTPDEAAFREELRTVYTAKISQDQLHALVDQIGDYDIVAL